jgi:hypothetical protein
MWLTAVPTAKNPNPRPNPIEVNPHEKGNLVIDRNKGLYRVATTTEIEVARRDKKNLYISHYATCPFAREFTKKGK